MVILNNLSLLFYKPCFYIICIQKSNLIKMQVSPIVKNESLMTWQKVEQNQQKGCIAYFDHPHSHVITNKLTNGCSHNNTYHKKCNVCLVFSCFKVVILFVAKFIRFFYIVVFLIYHGNMWINLKLIQWIKTLIKHYKFCFQVVKGLVNGFQFFESNFFAKFLTWTLIK